MVSSKEIAIWTVPCRISEYAHMSYLCQGQAPNLNHVGAERSRYLDHCCRRRYGDGTDRLIESANPRKRESFAQGQSQMNFPRSLFSAPSSWR